MARSAVAAAWRACRGRMPWIASTTGIDQQGDEGQAAIPGCGAVLRVSTGEMEHGPKIRGGMPTARRGAARGDGNQDGAGAQNERQQEAKGRQRGRAVSTDSREVDDDRAGSRCWVLDGDAFAVASLQLRQQRQRIVVIAEAHRLAGCSESRAPKMAAWRKAWRRRGRRTGRWLPAWCGCKRGSAAWGTP